LLLLKLRRMIDSFGADVVDVPGVPDGYVTKLFTMISDFLTK
jgi:hypothetical protein